MACCLPCYDPGLFGPSHPVTVEGSKFFLQRSPPIAGWECLTQGIGFSFCLWLPNLILFIGWILVWRRRPSAKYWAVSALFSAVCGISAQFIWPGADLWITSMALSAVAGVILVPVKTPLISWTHVARHRAPDYRGHTGRIPESVTAVWWRIGDSNP